MAKTTKIDSITLSGASGAEYTLRIYVWETAFKAVPGVYVVASRDVDPNRSTSYTPIFVGTTDDLSTAFGAHPRSECFQMYLANVIGVVHQKDAAVRARIADDLIAALAPPCNSPDEE